MGAAFEYRDGLPDGPVRGRGAGLNPGNRFEDVRLHVRGEHLDAVLVEHDAQRQATTRVLPDQTRTLINHVDPAKSPDIGFRWTINPYRGCEHGCTYCRFCHGNTAPEGAVAVPARKSHVHYWPSALWGRRHMHLPTSVQAILLVMSISLVGCSFSPKHVTVSSDDEIRAVDDRTASRTDALSLEGPDVTDAAVSVISRFPNLRWLYLRETSVTDAGLEDLPSMPNLIHLGVPGTSIADAGLAIIVDAAPTLGFLDLSHTKITDDGITLLRRLPRLQGLDASYTDITTASLPSLGQIRRLDFLNVEGTSIPELEVYRLFDLEDEWHRRQEQSWPPEQITVP